MRRTTISASVLLLVAVSMVAAPLRSAGSESYESYGTDGAAIDLVIALDTSGTMRGLINTTRVKIWEIVNELAVNEPAPDLRIALITYGNQIGSPANGWVRVEADLTRDLDLISERLFALRSRGANEYVGRALQAAIEKLSWSSSGDALKFIFLAGNEPPGQDPDVSYKEMSELALELGIHVNAVFCGPSDSQDAVGWKEMAFLAEGQFAAIDHNLPAVMIATPVDSELVELGDLMNETYVPYGPEGKSRKKSRANQDRNARKQGAAVAATRAITKASSIYSSAGDLVEAHDRGLVDVLTLDADELPRQLRGMTPDERLAFISDMSEIRRELRERIAELGAKRRSIVDEREVIRANAPRAFDDVVRNTIRDHARSAGFDFQGE